MRTPVQILSTEAVKDAEGFSTQQDTVLANVWAYHEARHGSERWANRAAFSEATDLFRFRVIPGVEISTKLFLLCEGCRYDITSVEDVKGRGMYVEILAKRWWLLVERKRNGVPRKAAGLCGEKEPQRIE